jgi:very-short-patch-repair endonuclease
MSVKRQSADHEMIRRARQLRRDMTGPECRLWYALRDRRVVGSKFRRQVVIGPYIVDFYNHAARLVVELDGDSHADRGASDRAREAWLEAQGLRVIRISNDDVLHDLEGAVEGIANALGSQTMHEHDRMSD